MLWSSVIANQSQEENRTILENSVSKSMLWKLCSWSISVSVWGVYRWFVGKLWVHLKDIWFCTFVSCIFDTQVDNMTLRWYIIIEGSPKGLECRSLRKKSKQILSLFVYNKSTCDILYPLPAEQRLQPPNFSSEILSKIWVNSCISE